MPSPIEIAFSGNVAGATFDGPITAVPFNAAMSAQNAHYQGSVTVEPADISRDVAIPAATDIGPAGCVQTLFVLRSQRPVQIKLNATVALTFNLTGPKCMFVLTGTPDITLVEFTGTAALRSSVSILKVVGTPTADT